MRLCAREQPRTLSRIEPVHTHTAFDRLRKLEAAFHRLHAELVEAHIALGRLRQRPKGAGNRLRALRFGNDGCVGRVLACWSIFSMGVFHFS